MSKKKKHKAIYNSDPVEVNNFDQFGNKTKVYITKNGKRIPINSERVGIVTRLKKVMKVIKNRRRTASKSRMYNLKKK